MKIRTLALASGAALSLAGCAAMNDAGGMGAVSGETATATLRSADGTDVGRVTAAGMGEGVHIMLTAYGLPAGTHGAHIHMTGRCDAPDFTSAGGHWNPTNEDHGTMDNDPGAHGGDLPNLVIGANGTGSIDAMSPAGTFDEMLDADGAAFVIHRDADDMMTDPSGSAGPRIACGVFTRS